LQILSSNPSSTKREKKKKKRAILKELKEGMVAHPEAEAGAAQVGGQPGLHRDTMSQNK
jgi:hypothetical protein